MVKKVKSKVENLQSYIRSKKSKQLRELAFKFRNELLDLETPAEVIFKSLLVKLNIKYEFQKILYAGKSFYIVDFYLPKISTVIEIDGKHHLEVDKLELDEDRTLNLKRVGVHNVYRFNNDEVFNANRCIIKIKDILKNEKFSKKISKQ